MSILVTGGAGYIGSHTAVELLKSRKRNSNNRRTFQTANQKY